MSKKIIFHVIKKDLWSTLPEIDEIRPEDIGEDGFIHCCTHAQIDAVLEKWFADEKGLLILEINTEDLSAPVVYENLEGGEESFPHVYGAINRSAINNIVKVKETE